MTRWCILNSPVSCGLRRRHINEHSNSSIWHQFGAGVPIRMSLDVCLRCLWMLQKMLTKVADFHSFTDTRLNRKCVRTELQVWEREVSSSTVFDSNSTNVLNEENINNINSCSLFTAVNPLITCLRGTKGQNGTFSIFNYDIVKEMRFVSSHSCSSKSAAIKSSQHALYFFFI